VATLAVFFGLSLLSALAVWYFHSHGYLLWYGDAEAHLNAARRIIDSTTPGFDQFGTPWLPLPHLLLIPFVRIDAWWQSGIAAAPPAAFCFVLGGVLLFAAVRRIFDSTAAAFAATALCALNPNLLYLQSTAMTEAFFFAALAALLYCTVSDRPILAALATNAAVLTRYEGWFLIPFVALYFFVRSPRRAFLYSAVAAIGPLWWLFYNWWLTADALAFYRGPNSARAIQRGQFYPGLHNARQAWLYYSTAVRLCAGPGLVLMALAGTVVALARRAFWPLLLLSLPPLFYLWSMYSSGGTPIFVPTLWPHAWYNTRYGLAALPLLAFASAALVTAVPRPLQAVTAILVVVAGAIFFAVHHQPSDWVTWAEARANSTGRRAWMTAAADYLRPRYKPGAGIVSSGGDDFFGIYRTAGIPLAETFNVDNGLPWNAALRRPQLYLWQAWAVALSNDKVHRALLQDLAHWELQASFAAKDEPVVYIYRHHSSP
jgi:hypothetical protein